MARMTPQPEEWGLIATEIVYRNITLTHRLRCKAMVKDVATALRQTAERAAEREKERCARIAETFSKCVPSQGGDIYVDEGARSIAAAIRSGQGER